MSYIFAAIGVVIWLGLAFVVMGMFIDELEVFESRSKTIALAIVLTIGLIAVLIWVANQSDNRPCVRYDTTMQYNAATKTTMPVRYCAQYGEWVDNER